MLKKISNNTLYYKLYLQEDDFYYLEIQFFDSPVRSLEILGAISQPSLLAIKLTFKLLNTNIHK